MLALPSQLAPVTDLGSRLGDGSHHLITIDADLPIRFCDPASPWQRGSNENTNGLLRELYPQAQT